MKKRYATACLKKCPCCGLEFFVRRRQHLLCDKCSREGSVYNKFRKNKKGSWVRIQQSKIEELDKLLLTFTPKTREAIITDGIALEDRYKEIAKKIKS